MSTDCYIDVYRSEDGTGSMIACRRIGHLGDFQSPNTVDFSPFLHFLCDAYPLIDDHLIAVLTSAVDEFKIHFVFWSKNYTDFPRHADCVDGEGIADFLAPHKGLCWYYRVD